MTKKREFMFGKPKLPREWDKGTKIRHAQNIALRGGKYKQQQRAAPSMPTLSMQTKEIDNA